MILVDFTPVLPELFSLGLVGVGLVSWLGDEGAEEVDQEGADDFDDEFEMDDEEFGDFDDDLDGLDGMEEGNGASSTELENRIEDLENEVANVSSTANTVRSENEQISEQVEEVEENVRKLLEIYEMVTRGVNPFVDDVSPEAGMGGGGNDFGLFGDEEGDEETADEDLESDIADAEAEEFFDDDAFDEEFEDDGGDGADDEFDVEFDDEEFAEDDEAFDAEGEEDLDDLGDFDDDLDEEFDDEAFDEDTGGEEAESDGDSGGGTSFEELKAEYESGDADWADDESFEEDAAEEDLGTDIPEDVGEASEASVDGTDAGSEDSPELFRQDDLREAGDDESTEPGTDETEAGTAEADKVPATESAETADGEQETAEASTEAFQFGAAAATAGDGGPHLETPPSGYLADVVLLEWLSGLLAEFGPRNAMRAVNHYERIGWIGEPMADHCFGMLQGLTDGQQPFRDETGPTDLSMADHRRSLRYVEELAAGRLDRELGDRLSGTDGVQR